MTYHGTKQVKEIIESSCLKSFAVSPAKEYHHFSFGYHTVSVPASFGELDKARTEALRLANDEGWA